MKEEIQKDYGECPFFKFCGAEVIRERRGENWRQQFCFADYKKCDHYQDRKKIRKGGFENESYRKNYRKS